MTTAMICAVCLALWLATLLPLSTHPAWWVRIWEFPRLQLAVLLLFALLAAVTLLDLSWPGTWLVMAVTAACLTYQAWWILPYTRLWKKEVLPCRRPCQRELRIMAANVLTTNRQSDALLALVRDARPDVLVTLETDRWWEARLDALLPDYPHVIRCPLDNLYGMHVYSRLPLRDAEIAYLVERDVPSMHATVVMQDGIDVRMHFLHPAPPSPTENEESVERDVELMLVAKSLEGHEGPAIVTGDLNDVAWSPTTRLFRRTSGLLDPRVGRGMYNTYHAQHWFLRWPLDHLFHSAHFTVSEVRRLPGFGSDHFPVLIALNYEGQAAERQQEGLEKSDGDAERAREILAQEDVQVRDVPEPRAATPPH